MVLRLTALLSESFNFSEINPLLPCLPCCAVTFLLPHFQEHREEILSTIATAFTVDFIFLFHKSLLTEILGLLSSFMKKNIIYKYMIATVTRSGPQGTTNYRMEVDAKDKMGLSNLHTICSFLLNAALGKSGSYEKLISLV